MKIDLNAIVDPYDARVVVTPGLEGSPLQACFDLVGLPRVEGMLIGKTAAQAVDITEHLCGICPAAHHLAGTRALDQLLDSREPVPDVAQAVRRLLHYGSHLEQHALRFAPLDREVAIELRSFGKQAMAAAGSPGHFPVTALPGGVARLPDAAQLRALAKAAQGAIVAAGRACELAFAGTESTSGFSGINVALADSARVPDLLGSHVKSVAESGEQLLFEPADRWPELVAEAIPGEIAPKPYLVPFGEQAGYYRVGPAAQLSIGELGTPLAAAAQERWLASPRSALAARAVIALHCAEAISLICEKWTPGLDPHVQCAHGGQVQELTLRAGTATGLVDSPRGILEHTYTLDTSGVVTAARILTPTAQNEPWLGQLLTAALASARSEAEREAALEESIREADPCLPISSAPKGTMSLRVDILD